MFRNQYDVDVTTWSPAGRLHQVEYSLEAVKQGSAAIGLKSKTHVVLVSLKRAPHTELSSYQRKLFKIDQHCGIAIAGLTADARVLTKYMRTECLNHKFLYDSPMPVTRLVTKVADKSQVCTQRASKRPFGVGLLVAGFDETGAHLYQTDPSGNFFDWKAIAIGARSQSAKTYLEKHFESFENATLEELIRHALIALRDTTGDNVDLTTRNCSIGIVGKDTPFIINDEEQVKPYLDQIEQKEQKPAAEAGSAPAGMDTDE